MQISMKSRGFYRKNRFLTPKMIFTGKLMFYKDVRRDLRNSLSYRLAQTDLK